MILWSWWQTSWLDLILSIFILSPLQDIFCLIVGTFGGLNEINGPSFGRRVVILETLARYRSCVVMLDLECDDLVNELFRTFLNVVRYGFSVIHLINYADCCPRHVTGSYHLIKVLIEDKIAFVSFHVIILGNFILNFAYLWNIKCSEM